MNLRSSHFTRLHNSLATVLVLAACAVTPGIARANDVPELLDDFSDPHRTRAGIERIVIDDSSIGGKSHASQSSADGVLSVEGEIFPGRGQPGFVSLILLLAPAGEPRDLSGYEGIRIRVHVTKGALTVVAASSEIQNFDYHATAIPRTSKGLQEIKIPFEDLKRVWSEQTPLNLETISSINLVASGLQKGGFAYEVDEVGFY